MQRILSLSSALLCGPAKILEFECRAVAMGSEQLVAIVAFPAVVVAFAHSGAEISGKLIVGDIPFRYHPVEGIEEIKQIAAITSPDVGLDKPLQKGCP